MPGREPLCEAGEKDRLRAAHLAGRRLRACPAGDQEAQRGPSGCGGRRGHPPGQRAPLRPEQPGLRLRAPPGTPAPIQRPAARPRSPALRPPAARRALGPQSLQAPSSPDPASPAAGGRKTGHSPPAARTASGSGGSSARPSRESVPLYLGIYSRSFQCRSLPSALCLWRKQDIPFGHPPTNSVHEWGRSGAGGAAPRGRRKGGQPNSG